MAKQFTLDELKEAAVALKELQIQIGEKHDPASTASTWPGPHGTNGLFADGTVRPRMFSAIPGVVDEIVNSLPLVPSNKDNEIVEILTGITATEGTPAADICSEGPGAGRLKVMRQTVAWGEMKVDTEVERLNNQGRRRDYADLDRQVVNLMVENNPYIPDFVTKNINTRLGKKAIELGLGVTLGYSRTDFVGVQGASSSAAYLNQFISQYDGWERKVKTGYTDSVSGVAAPDADSVIIPHNAAIASNGTNGVSFVENVVDAYYSVVNIADEVGMGDVTFEIWMNRKTFRAVAYQWACAYYTAMCGVGTAGLPIVQEATAITQIREEMLRNKILMIDGVPVQVRVSDGIPATGIANQQYNSDIYIMPRYWRGEPLVYRQYFPLNNAEAQEFIQNSPEARIINGGLYAVGRRTTNGFCTKWEFYSKSRLMLEAPFLAARINDVQFTYRAQDRDVFVGDSNYKNGGQSGRL